MIDALDVQPRPSARAAAHARRQPGCRALMSHYGIGRADRRAILAELGDAGRFTSLRQAVRYAGLDITVHQSDQRRAAPDTSPAKARRHCAGRCMKPPRPRAARQPRPRLLRPGSRSGSAATAPASPSPANCSSAASTPCANSATRPSNPPDRSAGCARRPPSHRCPAARSPHAAAATPRWTASKDRAAAPHPPREHPINHHVTDPEPRARTEISPGARTHHTRPDHHAHDPPPPATSHPTLTPPTGTDKQHWCAGCGPRHLGCLVLRTVRAEHRGCPFRPSLQGAHGGHHPQRHRDTVHAGAHRHGAGLAPGQAVPSAAVAHAKPAPRDPAFPSPGRRQRRRTTAMIGVRRTRRDRQARRTVQQPASRARARADHHAEKAGVAGVARSAGAAEPRGPGRTAQRVPRLDARTGAVAALAAREATATSRQAQLTATRGGHAAPFPVILLLSHVSTTVR